MTDTHAPAETFLKPSYRACHECGHLYQTKRELRYAYRWEHHIGPFTFLAALLTPASRIHFCPLCMHDFLPEQWAATTEEQWAEVRKP